MNQNEEYVEKSFTVYCKILDSFIIYGKSIKVYTVKVLKSYLKN